MPIPNGMRRVNKVATNRITKFLFRRLPGWVSHFLELKPVLDNQATSG